VSGSILVLIAVLASGPGQVRLASRRVAFSLTPRLGAAFGTVGSLFASPSSVSFTASNPDAGVVSGSSPASLSWAILSGSHVNSWTLSVQADTSSFSGCPTIPVSAVQVSCSSASVGGTGGTASCSGSFALGTTGQQLAGGLQADGSNSYLVSATFTLAESWRYVANPSCSINLTYSVNAQ
jgi:hypothetical protein